MYREWSVARRLSCVVVLVSSLLAACATAGRQQATTDEERWGVKVLQVRLTAEGLMLDFRYRVLDAEKAAPLFSRQSIAYLIDEATGAKFLVPESPKIGALRTTRPPHKDKNYFIIFVNPGRYVKKGAKVTVVIGEFKVEHLIVQ